MVGQVLYQYQDNKTEGRLEFDPEYFNRVAFWLGTFFFLLQTEHVRSEICLQERYFIYSMSNCLYSAMVGAVGRKCNCTPIYTRLTFVPWWKTPLHLQFTFRSVPELPLTNLENRPYCTGHQLRCMEVCTRLYKDLLFKCQCCFLEPDQIVGKQRELSQQSSRYEAPWGS